MEGGSRRTSRTRREQKLLAFSGFGFRVEAGFGEGSGLSVHGWFRE